MAQKAGLHISVEPSCLRKYDSLAETGGICPNAVISVGIGFVPVINTLVEIGTPTVAHTKRIFCIIKAESVEVHTDKRFRDKPGGFSG